MDAHVHFDEFVSARWVRLYRLAFLLTTDEAAAEDLLQTAMEKTFARWPQVTRMESPEAYVRTLMVNAVISEQPPPGASARVAEGGACPSARCRPRTDGSWTTCCCGRWCVPCPSGNEPSSCCASTRTSASGRPPTCSAAPWAP